MSLVAVGLAWVLLYSGLFDVNQGDVWWLYSGDPETARNLLSAIMSGMITMTSLVVSITMVVLSLAAGQLGPRLIANFLSDRQIQAVLGLFMATILYTLFVLRSLSDDADSASVPHLAVSLASLLAMICLFALLFYVQKIARSIIADTVVTHVANDLEQVIASAKTDDTPTHADDDAREMARYDRREWVALGQAGHVQVIDHDRLVALAAREDMLLRLNFRAGKFLLCGGHHVEMFSHAVPSLGFTDEIKRAVVIGAERTATQDLEYSVRQLVEIAVRALSTGINDPFTALLVVDRLGASLESVSQRPPPPERYRDGDGRVRLLARPPEFAGLLDASFNQIRQAAAGNAAVLIEMSRIISHLAIVVDVPERRAALLAHQQKLDRSAHRTLADPADLADFMDTAATAHKRLSDADDDKQAPAG